MTQQVEVPITKADNRVQAPGLSWWKERTTPTVVLIPTGMPQQACNINKQKCNKEIMNIS